MLEVVALGLDCSEGGATQAVQLEGQALPLRTKHLRQSILAQLSSACCWLEGSTRASKTSDSLPTPIWLPTAATLPRLTRARRARKS